MTEMRDAEPEPGKYIWVLDCPCGLRLRSDSEDGIVCVALAHLSNVHPELSENYEREHILFMATKLLR